MLTCCLYVVFYDEIVQITDKNALHRWNKEKLGYPALIILVIIVTYFLESNQITQKCNQLPSEAYFGLLRL